MTSKRLTTYTLNKKFIKHWLIDHDLTQDDFAKTLGISTSNFNELLNGRKSISLRNLFSNSIEWAVVNEVEVIA